MNVAAEAVLKDLPDLVLAYGQSDEYRYARLSSLYPSLMEIGFLRNEDYVQLSLRDKSKDLEHEGHVD